MKNGFSLIEIFISIVIIAVAALVLFGLFGNALSGMTKVYQESIKTFEANQELEQYFLNPESQVQVVISTSNLRIDGLSSLPIVIIRPPSKYSNIPLFIFEPK